jgi:hypothetical protein
MGRGEGSDGLGLLEAKASIKHNPETQWFFSRLGQVDFRYAAEVEYDSGSYYCECDDICRCSTIENIRVTEIDLLGTAHKIYDKRWVGERPSKNATLAQLTSAEAYKVERVLHSFRLWEHLGGNYDNWDVDVEGGYYGDELGEVHMEKSLQQSLADYVALFQDMSPEEAIAKMLSEEKEQDFSYIASSELEFKKIPITLIDGFKPPSISPTSLQAENTSYRFYNMENAFPIALVEETETGYSLLDGQERLAGAFIAHAKDYTKTAKQKEQAVKVKVLAIKPKI